MALDFMIEMIIHVVGVVTDHSHHLHSPEPVPGWSFAAPETEPRRHPVRGGATNLIREFILKNNSLSIL